MVRSAFTLIELIFAIVVIGISVISLPMMTQVTTSSIEGNMVQEAIFAAATELNLAITANWDDHSIEAANPNSLARVIDDGTCSAIAALVAPRRKVGHIDQPLHRRCLDDDQTVVTYADADTSANVVALDELEKTNSNAFTAETVLQAGYKNQYNVTIDVTRPANFNGNNVAIKEIEVTISDADGIVTSLKTYSANVGEVDYFKRMY